MARQTEIESENYLKEWEILSLVTRTTRPTGTTKMPLLALNHVSFVVKSVRKTVKFYQDVLGFMLIKRPSSFNFEGAWLFNNGIGIHLLESEENAPTKKLKINPKDNHISFQTSNMRLLMERLEDMGIEYVTAVVEDGGIKVDQLFFHDPDGYMIEICNCQNLPVVPLSSSSPVGLPETIINTQLSILEKRSRLESPCGREAAALIMMENLALEMLGISI